jgi:hypothetical protein
MIVAWLAEAGHDLDSALLHSAQGQQAVGDALQPIRTPTNHDDLQAKVVADVHVQCRPHLLAQLVLQLGQPFAEVAHVVVVDQGQGGDGVHGLGHLVAAHLGARQVAKHLGARAAARADHGVELAQKRTFEGHAESNQGVLHRGKTTAPPNPMERACWSRLSRRLAPARSS